MRILFGLFPIVIFMCLIFSVLTGLLKMNSVLDIHISYAFLWTVICWAVGLISGLHHVTGD